MTAVMRAVSQQAGPKILRIGVVQAGKVVDERLIKKRDHVTIGPSEKAMFVVPSRKIPPQFRLFEMAGNDYHLNYLEGMTGRVALKTGISDLTALAGTAKSVSIGGMKAHQVRLTEDSRGKVVVGETTFLFQFVVPPPVQPRPQLPVSVRSGFAGEIDWFTTIVAAFSFLLHFFGVALVYSDWMDPVADQELTIDQLVESVKSLPPPPPIEKQQVADTDSTAAATSDEATDKPAAKAAPKSGAGAGKGNAGPDKGKGNDKAAQDEQAAEIASELAELDVGMIAVFGGDGAALEGVLGDSEVPTGLLDEAGRSGIGAGSGGGGGLNLGGSGSGSVKPGAGGGGKGLKDIGETGGSAGGGAATAGTAKTVEGPKGSAMVGGAGVAGGKVANASSVVARMKGRFRNCYNAGLKSDPEMAGSATLTARIGPSGEVTSVGGGASGGLSKIVPCLKSVVRGGGFAAPEGGSAMISIPITFVKQ